MLIDILSLFPEFFQSPFDVSIVKRARDKGLIELRQTNIRDFSVDKHKKVDDRPFGGGPGMVLAPQPVCAALRQVKTAASYVVHLSPQGEPLNAKKCQQLAQLPHLVLLCGHYEGIDQRVIDTEIDEEISIGDYVLTNGCIAAIVLVDALIRFIPGVLGHAEAALQDSFQEDRFDCPQYTRPEVFEGISVPSVLLQGNHAAIAKWRYQKSLEKTLKKRPQLVLQHFLAKKLNILQEGERP